MKRLKRCIYSIFSISLLVLILCSCEDTNSDYDENESLNYSLIVADYTSERYGAIISIEPDSGKQTIISTGGLFQMGPADVVIDENGYIFTTLTSPPSIVKIDPDSGQQTLISSGDYLKYSIKGIAFDADGNILVTKGEVSLDRNPYLLRIDPFSKRAIFEYL